MRVQPVVSIVGLVPRDRPQRWGWGPRARAPRELGQETAFPKGSAEPCCALPDFFAFS